jgi:Sulfatase/Periplasmic binding protein-like domain
MARLGILCGLTVLTSISGPTQGAYAQDIANSKPNIVFILIGNLGYGEVGAFGGGITRGAATPRIDQLASEGTRLTNYNVEAQCTPSRSAILTGRFSIRSGTHSVPIGGGVEGLTQWEVTIAETLSDAGYTMGIGVPDDLAIVAYDNSAVASLSLIDLASIDQSGRVLGAVAAELLLSRIGGRTEAQHSLIEPHLVRRSSM